METKQVKTDWARVDAIKDEDIDYSDIPEVTDEQFTNATFVPAKNQSWPFTITPDTPSGFFAQSVDIEEAFTRGNTMAEATHNASEVLSGILNFRKDNNIFIPEPSATQPGQVAVIPFLPEKVTPFND